MQHTTLALLKSSTTYKTQHALPVLPLPHNAVLKTHPPLASLPLKFICKQANIARSPSLWLSINPTSACASPTLTTRFYLNTAPVWKRACLASTIWIQRSQRLDSSHVICKPIKKTPPFCKHKQREKPDRVQPKARNENKGKRRIWKE
jgi:hypothetical protein